MNWPVEGTNVTPLLPSVSPVWWFVPASSIHPSQPSVLEVELEQSPGAEPAQARAHPVTAPVDMLTDASLVVWPPTVLPAKPPNLTQPILGDQA
jgi:hypothetical protein